MEIDDSDNILFDEQTRIYNNGKSEYYENHLEFLKNYNQQVDYYNEIQNTQIQNDNYKRELKDELIVDNSTSTSTYCPFDIATRMTVDIKNIKGNYYLFVENLCKVMDVIVAYNLYNVIHKTTLKKNDCVGGYTIIYTCSEGIMYLNTYEFYDYATFYMDVCRVPERHYEFFEIYNFLTELFNSDEHSENITITTSTIDNSSMNEN